MATVVERTFGPDGAIEDRPSSYEAAEAIAGRRLDRRRGYAIIMGRVCESARWSSACSGCSEDGSDRGLGCDECGYTGRRRQSIWVPREYAV